MKIYCIIASNKAPSPLVLRFLRSQVWPQSGVGMSARATNNPAALDQRFGVAKSGSGMSHCYGLIGRTPRCHRSRDPAVALGARSPRTSTVTRACLAITITTLCTAWKHTSESSGSACLGSPAIGQYQFVYRTSAPQTIMLTRARPMRCMRRWSDTSSHGDPVCSESSFV